LIASKIASARLVMIAIRALGADLRGDLTGLHRIACRTGDEPRPRRSGDRGREAVYDDIA
jgi:hypothetical protein